MKVKIKRYTAVAAWRWNGVEDDDVCGICRRQYDATCPECKYPGEGCPLIFGQCGHAFHNHCLNTWLTGSITSSSQKNTKCPMCRAEFTERLTDAQRKRREEVEQVRVGSAGRQSQQPNVATTRTPNTNNNPQLERQESRPPEMSDEDLDSQMETS